MQPLGEGEEPPMVPEPIERDEGLELPSMEDVAAEAASGSMGGAVQAGEAGMEELTALAPEDFVDPTDALAWKVHNSTLSECVEMCWGIWVLHRGTQKRERRYARILNK
eukprot:454674-Pelagomonas_calceolata.AAC.3